MSTFHKDCMKVRMCATEDSLWLKTFLSEPLNHADSAPAKQVMKVQQAQGFFVLVHHD